MRRISLTLMTVVAFGLGILPMAGMAKMPEKSCLPVARDYFWLDLSRMGMGMGMNRREAGREAEPNADASGGKRQVAASSSGSWNRRLRVVRLRHDGFPPQDTGGCLACQTSSGGSGRSVKGEWRRAAGEWRKMGAEPALRKAVLWLETPDNLIRRIEPGQPGRMRFNARMWGQYRLFAYLDAGVRNGVRHRHFAFLDLFAHGDDVAKKTRPDINGDGYMNSRPLFFLERLYDSEAQRYRTQTGEEARFRLTLHGQPVKGACVVMITQKDWRQARRTDENGEVSFFLIKETPSGGGWRARRRSEKYLVVAQHTVPAAGTDGGVKATRYVATQLLRVRPSRLEWESKSTAFLLASFTVVAAGAAIAIRRARRRRCRGEGRA